MTENAIFVWDWTYFPEEKETWEDVAKKLKETCKKWVFQEEACPSTGKKHFQGRSSLKTKSRTGWKAMGFDIGKGRASATHDSDSKHFDFYATKIESRINGPYSDKDPEKPYIPIDIREIMSLLPWQTQLFEACKNRRNFRKIYYVYDPKGNIGKTTWARWMAVNQHAKCLPMVNDSKDLMRMCLDVGVQPTYIVDMPRSINKERLYQFYGALEMIKSGYAYDDRYRFQDKYFDPPNVVVFSNKFPDVGMLSKDRWVIVRVNPETKLFDYISEDSWDAIKKAEKAEE